MQIDVLRPLRVRRDDGSDIAVTARQERVALALLVLENRSVSTDLLVDAIWSESPPASALNQVQKCMSRLRTLLGRYTIETDPAGYRIAPAMVRVDLWEFRRLTADARAVGRGDAARARKLYRQALAYWRNPALGSMRSDYLDRAAAFLEEEWLRTVDECIDCELALGGGGELVAELTDLVSKYPYRESLRRALMLALHRSGRQKDALAAYQQVRELLVAGLGQEPGPTLQDLHRRILAEDPTLLADASPRCGDENVPVPHELPAPPHAFTGRIAELALLDKTVGDEAMTVAVLHGMAGVGKSALALHWAHLVADRYPDGQLYLDLRGFTPNAQPIRPIEGLAHLLRSLGVPPEQIPADEAQAAALYRTLLAGRRALIVLDNARSSTQVLPLLPASAGCLVLVTSRELLTSLVAQSGAQLVAVDVLDSEDAYALLVRLLGRERVDQEPQEACALAHACAYLPLALRVAAANLAAPPTRTIASHLAELRGARNHVRPASPHADPESDESVIDAISAVNSALDVSVRSVPDPVQRFFVALGLVQVPSITPAAAAALTAITEADARRQLRRLAAAHLIDEPVPDRFSLHDLVRAYTQALCHQHTTPADRGVALSRLLSWYIATADAADTCLRPMSLRSPLPPLPHEVPPPASFTDTAQAKAWFDSERPNLLAVVRHASEAATWEPAWLLVDRLQGYLRTHGFKSDLAAATATSLANAKQAGDQWGEAASRIHIADDLSDRGRYSEAADEFSTALELVRRIGWREAEPRILDKIGRAHQYAGRLDRAMHYLRESIALAEKNGQVVAKGIALGVLGGLCARIGRLAEAADVLTEGQAVRRQLGDEGGVIITTGNLGTVRHYQGRLHEAADLLSWALTRAQETGHPYLNIHAGDNLAAVYRDLSRLAEALELTSEAVARAVQLGERRAEAFTRSTQGSVFLRMGDPRKAVGCYTSALEVARSTEEHEAALEALLGHAAASLRLGILGEAEDGALRALPSAREHGYRLLEGQALALLAAVCCAEGRTGDARAYAEQALVNHRDTGHRLGEARALAALGSIAQHEGAAHLAGDYTNGARSLLRELGVPDPDGFLRTHLPPP